MSKDVIIGLSASRKLAQKVANHLHLPLCDVEVLHFADGETMVRSTESLRGKHVYVIQATCKPVNENLMELLIAIDSFKRASAKSINVIIPYFGYARQDRKTAGREPITCKLCADLLEKAGATRIVVLDLHSDQAQGFFDIPVDTISASYALLNAIKKDHTLKNSVIVSPDYGSVKRARKLSKIVNLPIAILDKRRPKPNVAEICNILGDVKGKQCIIVDDMIDTGGTLIGACRALKKAGAKSVITAATHGLFSGNASINFNQALKERVISDIYVTNSMDAVYDVNIKGLKIIDLSKFFSDVIAVYISNGNKTITDLFKTTKVIY